MESSSRMSTRGCFGEAGVDLGCYIFRAGLTNRKIRSVTDQRFKLFHTLKPRDQVEGGGMGLAWCTRVVLSQAAGSGTPILRATTVAA
jgi:hypothetical protein